MDLDPLDMVAEPSTLDDERPAADHRKRARLNAAVAITVALLATFMGICKIKDDNICQAMQQAQADKIDHWSYYQARNLRQEIAESAATQLRLQQPSQPAAAQGGYAAAIARYDRLVQDQSQKKDEARAQASADQARYDALNYRDDQFDLSDALLAIAISMLAVAALTQLRWLYLLSLLPSGFGVLMGVAGLVGLHIHPDRLSALLG
jgi:ribosomal protein S13